MEIIDLTRILDDHLSIYTDGDYTDPPLEIDTWCTVQEQGYQVFCLSMGTQTGTHIDAPAHFVAGGASLEALPLQALMGLYRWVDLNQVTPAELKELGSDPSSGTILFLASSPHAEVIISQEVFNALLCLPCLVWVIANGTRVAGREEYFFNRSLAEAGKFLIEDVDESAAMLVKPGGQIIALPLRLGGVPGSPCRVIVRQ